MSPRATARLVERSQKSFAGGMNDSAEPDEYGANEVAVLFNARVVSESDAVQRRGGSQRMHATALNSGAQIYGGTEYYDASGNRFMIVCAGTVAYSSDDDGITWTSLATGLPTGGWDFTVMQSGADRLLIGVVGSGPPQIFDGSTWTDLTGTSIPDDATHCEFHNNRLWLWGHNNPLLQGSKVDDPTDFSAGAGGVTVRIENTIGDPTPRGLWSHGPALLAFTYEQVGFVEGWGLNTIQVTTGHRGLSRSLGCVSHRTIAPAGDTGVMWLSRQGWIYMPLGGTPELISGKMQRFVDGLSWDNMASNPHIPAATWSSALREYHCAVPAYGNNQNTHTMVIRMPDSGNPLSRYVFRSEKLTGQSFEISDGVLELTTGGREAAIIAGVFELQPVGVPGTAVEITDGVLKLATKDFVPATIFTADHDSEDRAGALWSGGYDGFVRRMEFGDLDDVLSDDSGGEDVSAWIRGRPETFGDQFRRKRLRSIRTALKAKAGGTIDVYPVIDGQAGSKVTKTLRSQETTQVARALVTGKAYLPQVDLRFTDDLTIQGTAPSAELLRESP